MSIEVDPTVLVGFLLALVRTIAMLTVAPPFSGPFIPVRIRLGIAAGLSVATAGLLTPDQVPTLPAFVFSALDQVLLGLLFGFVIQMVLTAIQMAGSLIDLFAGFSAGSLYDPLTGATATPVARLYQLFGVAMLFALNGHLLILRGFLRSFEAGPAARAAPGPAGSALVGEIGNMLVAAAEIALPVLAALFLTEVALGLVAAAAPQMNVLILGFAAKAFVALAVLALAFPVISDATAELVVRGVRLGAATGGG